MYKFINYKMKHHNNFCVLSCMNILEFKNIQEEANYMGWSGTVTPSCWDDIIIDKIGTTQYFVHHLYGIQLNHGCFNKLSDFKGIHKLTNRPSGVYETSYVTPNGKVYVGASCSSGVEGFNSSISSFLIVGPKLNCEQFERIFSSFKERNYDFCTPPPIDLLELISSWCQQSIVLSYSSIRGSTLTVFPGNSDLFFEEAECNRWEMLVDVQPVLRKK